MTHGSEIFHNFSYLSNDSKGFGEEDYYDHF